MTLNVVSELVGYERPRILRVNNWNGKSFIHHVHIWKATDPSWITRSRVKTAGDYRLGFNGHPIGKGLWRIEWSRNRSRHVTSKGQGHDSNTHRAQYIENSCRCYLETISNYYTVSQKRPNFETV